MGLNNKFSGGKYTGGQDTNSTTSKSSSAYSNVATTSDLLTADQIALLEGVIQQQAGQQGQQGAQTSGAIDTLLAQLNNNGLTRDQALADSEGLIQGAARTLAEGNLKDISLQMQGAGASQDALGLLLGADAQARTAEAVGTSRAGIVADYVNAGSQSTSSIAGAIASLMNGQNASSGALADLFSTLKGSHSTKVQTGTELGNSTTTTAAYTKNYEARKPLDSPVGLSSPSGSFRRGSSSTAKQLGFGGAV